MRRTRILVVDDEKVIRDLLEDILASAGFQVLTAHNGYEALKISMECNLDLVIMDLLMPSMSGVDAIRAIRISQPELPVIILTGLGGDAMVEEGMKAGAMMVLTKPVRVRKVLECVREILEVPNIE